MILKKISTGILAVIILNGCAQNASLLGPVYTLAKTGNVYQAGFTYGGNEVIYKKTGKSATENLKKALTPVKEDSEFEKLVKRNIEKTRKKLILSNQ